MKKKFLSLLLSITLACSLPASSAFLFSETAVEAEADTLEGWVASGSEWKYYQNGEMVTGWIYYKSNWYFLDTETGIMKSSEWFLDQKGYMYYARSWGGIYLGTTVTIAGRSYTFDTAGRVSNFQWVFTDGNWYLIVDRKPVTGWYYYQNNWYYMNSDGTMKANEKIYHDGHWYFLNDWGGMRHSGWYKENGDWYYLYSWGGTANSGKTQIGKDWYYFYPDSGIMAADVEIDGDYYTSSGAMQKKVVGTQCTELKGLSEREVVELVGPLCTEDQRKTGILASITMAQFILESGYGNTDLAQKTNNCFGLKGTVGSNFPNSTWDGVSLYQKTGKEEDANGNTYYKVSNWRVYACMEDSIADHSAALLNSKTDYGPRYPGIGTEKDFRTAAYIIYNGGYATNHDYPEYLIRLINQWNLTRFDL